ncbi:MAG: AAA family ATPase [Bacteroidota bacterium]
MKKITIQHFGPIEKINNLQLEDNMLFIGPQANGKSTIAKAVYFFKQIRIDLIQYFLQKIDTNEPGKPPLTELGKIIRSKFMDFWGASFAYHPDLVLHYDYTKLVFINITLTADDKYINPAFSNALQVEINAVYDEINVVLNRIKQGTSDRSVEERLIRTSELHAFKLSIVKRINDLFEEDEELLFIPAGRSAFAVLTDEIVALSSKKVDTLTRDFAYKINERKVYFNKSLSEVISDEQSTSLRHVPLKMAQKAATLLSNILQGEYRIVNGEERIYYKEDRFVKLNYASSGQQESLWILLSIFINILKSTKVFVVFEEPEAHLFPKAQKDIVELIALLMNSTKGNKVMITTHSPYVLTAFNNLIYANDVGKEQSSLVDRIVDKDFWLDAARSAAYFVEKGSLRSIIHDGLIDANQIDSVSDEINELTDKMVEIKIS